MTLPAIPDANLRACLTVLQVACLHARRLGYDGQVKGLPAEGAQLLADLMDAVHNLPDLIERWPSCNQGLLRDMLADFDAKWPKAGISLLATYDRSARNPDP